MGSLKGHNTVMHKKKNQIYYAINLFMILILH